MSTKAYTLLGWLTWQGIKTVGARKVGQNKAKLGAAAIILTAHKELEKLVGTIHQNNFKPHLDDHWAYLVYAGLWYEPLLSDLNAFMDAVNEQVTGEVTLRLFKGSVRAVARRSPNALYDPALAGFGESGGLFSQQASPGFIELWSLQSRMAYKVRNREGGST